MKTFGILGHPVAHSRSPAMHRAALREAGLVAEYVPFDVRPQDLSEAVRGLRSLGVAGLNVTVPHKEAVIPLLDEVSDEARAIGAVNTIVVRGDVWRGENTDAPGLGAVFEEMGLALARAEVVLVGAGGAARAALAAVIALGCRSVAVANRTPERARGLEPYARAHGCAFAVLELDHALLAHPLSRASLLVQTTTLGMEGVDAGDWPDPIPIEAMRPGAAVVDLVYAPRPTPLLARARAVGLDTADGLSMLVHQGALSFTAWTGLAAPLAAMRKAAESP